MDQDTRCYTLEPPRNLLGVISLSLRLHLLTDNSTASAREAPPSEQDKWAARHRRDWNRISRTPRRDKDAGPLPQRARPLPPVLRRALFTSKAAQRRRRVRRFCNNDPRAHRFILLPAPHKQSSIFPALLALVCLTLSLASLVAAMVTEPGILPAAPPDEPREETKQARRKITHVVIRGHRIKLQERRAKYTRHTDSVVERFDHHCPWVGNAVGLRNYYYFVSFVFWTTMLALVVGLKSGLRLYTLSKSKHYLDRVEPWQVVGLASLTLIVW